MNFGKYLYSYDTINSHRLRETEQTAAGGTQAASGQDAMRAAEDASIEETLAKLKQQATDLQSQRENSSGGPPGAAAPSSAGLPSSLTTSDPDFMRQLAQLKEDHVSNLRVIERMYNQGQGGGGSALPDYDYDDGAASVL